MPARSYAVSGLNGLVKRFKKVFFRRDNTGAPKVVSPLNPLWIDKMYKISFYPDDPVPPVRERDCLPGREERPVLHSITERGPYLGEI